MNKKELIGTITEVTTECMICEFGDETPFKQGATIKTHPEKVATFYRKGNKIICTIETEGLKVKASSRCHPEDIFDLAEGCGIAELRARQRFYKALEDKYVDYISNPFTQMMKSMGQCYES